MAEKDVKVFDPQEKALPRGWIANRAWIRSHRGTRLLAFVLPALTTAIFIIKYQNGSPAWAVIFGLAAGFTGSVLLFLIALIGNLISSPKHQRDEARGEIVKVSAALEQKIKVLNASVKELVDLEGEHKALTETYRPIKELAAIKSGDTVKDKKFNVSLMFNQMNTSIVSNIIFENCTFLGPAVIQLLGSKWELSGTTFGGSGTIDNVVVKADSGKGYRGMCAFLDCKIRNCRFENIGILGDDALKDKLKPATTT